MSDTSGRDRTVSYCYTALPQNGLRDGDQPFRLLNLQPGSVNDPIEVELQAYNVKEAPAYETISYRWATDGESRKIRCNGCTFQVPTNVLQVLTELRGRETAKLLWIDVICIDQSNLRERSQQVSIMRTVYSQAMKTVIWLGPADGDTTKAFDAIPQLCEAREKLDASGVDYSRYFGDLSTTLKQNGYPITVALGKGIDALLKTLNQPWFERVWGTEIRNDHLRSLLANTIAVVQEVTVSKAAAVRQGSLEVSWERFLFALLLARDVRISALVEGMEEARYRRVLPNMRNAFSLGQIRDDWNSGITPSLRILLNWYRLGQATDPRDKVYALAGITDAYASSNPAMFSYEESVGDVYRLWTIHILRLEGSLEILSAANRYPSSESPVRCSWVPDWSTPGTSKAPHVLTSPTTDLQATKGSKIEPQFREEDTILGLAGYTIDSVVAVGSIYDTTVDTDPILGSNSAGKFFLKSEIWRSWEGVANIQRRDKYRPTNEDIYDAYWQTIAYGEASVNAQEKELAKRDFYPLFAMRRPWRRIEKFKIHSVKPLYWICSMFLNAWTNSKEEFDAKSMITFMMRCIQVAYRRMIRTKKGYIGLATHGAKVGDQIALFKGGRFPFVIRPADGQHWSLVGDSYIHGIMHGELWDEQKCEAFWIR